MIPCKIIFAFSFRFKNDDFSLSLAQHGVVKYVSCWLFGCIFMVGKSKHNRAQEEDWAGFCFQMKKWWQQWHFQTQAAIWRWFDVFHYSGRSVGAISGQGTSVPLKSTWHKNENVLSFSEISVKRWLRSTWTRYSAHASSCLSSSLLLQSFWIAGCVVKPAHKNFNKINIRVLFWRLGSINHFPHS